MAFEPMEDWKMGKKRHKAEEIVANLRQVEVLTAQRWSAPTRWSNLNVNAWLAFGLLE